MKKVVDNRTKKEIKKLGRCGQKEKVLNNVTQK